MSDLIFRLRRDHGNTRKLLRVAERQRVLFMAGDFLDEPIIDGLFAYLEYYPALYHHPLEDAVYRRLRERDEGAAGPFDDLEASHAELRDLLANFRIMAHQALFHAPISRQQFGDAADRFVEAYHRHIEEEEEFFFPSALEILRWQDWAEIGGQLSEPPDDPLFGTTLEQKLLALQEDILRWEEEA